MLRGPRIFFLAVLFSFMLSACGGGSGSGTSNPSGNPPENPSSTISLSWETPVSQADGKPLADLSGFNIYYGKSSLEYGNWIDVGNVRIYTLQNLPAGTYYFAISAYDSEGNETNLSPEISITLP